MPERRGLTLAVLAVAAGAGVVLFGATRVWWVEVVPRPAPLRPEEIAHTGASLAPLLPALGLVALAGAGGLLATQGMARRLVGALLGVVAVAVAVAVVTAWSGANPVWPAACLLGAGVVAAAGVAAVRYGGRWPGMGARYRRNQPRASRGGASQEVAGAGSPTPGGDAGAGLSGRATPSARVTSEVATTGSGATAGESAVSASRLSSAELWDAVDRGDDPTRD
jgi:hypothetical protein